MSTSHDLQTAHLCLKTAHFHGKRAHPQPTVNDARDLLAELGTPTRALTDTELARLGEGAVVRDQENYVCEKFGAGASALWYATRSTKPRRPVLPAWVLDEGEEPS